MINLKELIIQLDDETYVSLVENNANKKTNFTQLLELYRANKYTDEQIINKLNLNINSFYTLKSRLYDKIQKHFLQNTVNNKFELLKQVAQIPELCYATHREQATAVLKKLELDLLKHDMPEQLVQVYSALKKINCYSAKFYTYSQLYNKQLAYTVALEKAEELLINFNKTIASYYFSKNDELLDLLKLIAKEIKNISSLNNSHQIKLIKNTILIQLQLFCNINYEEEKDTVEILNDSFSILEKHLNDDAYFKKILSFDFLSFEYYMHIKQNKNTSLFFEKVNTNINLLFLMSSSCFASKFLFSKIEWYDYANKLNLLEDEIQSANLLKDENDKLTLFAIDYHLAFSKLINKKYKEASKIVNTTINTLDVKEFFHLEIEIKYLATYLYILQQESEMAANCLRSVYRKIKANKTNLYQNAIVLYKILSLLLTKENKKEPTEKLIKLFEFENSISKKPLFYFITNQIKKSLQ